MDLVRAYHGYFSQAVNAAANAVMINDAKGLKAAAESGKRGFLPAVEDLRIINGDLQNLQELRDMGVRIVTPLWGGTSIIGGAWNSQDRLTDFGRETVRAALSLGMIPDVSHASPDSTDEIAALCREAGKPCFASHSCSYMECRHPRNMVYSQLRAVADCGGIVGINLYPIFLCGLDRARLDDAVRHIRYIKSITGIDGVAIGSDFDGVDCLPAGVTSVRDLPHLADRLSFHEFTDDEIEKIFFTNAYRFLMENL